jgi:hypothetical protein
MTRLITRPQTQGSMPRMVVSTSGSSGIKPDPAGDEKT